MPVLVSDQRHCCEPAIGSFDGESKAAGWVDGVMEAERLAAQELLR